MPAPTGSRLEQILGRLDRRIVYAGLFLVTLAPLVGRWSMPLYVTEPPRRLYAAIESLPTDRLVVITSDWDAGTQAENRPQMIALVRHLIRRGLKFAMISIQYPTSPQLGHTAVEEAIRLEGVEATWTYGEDWVDLGYKAPEDPWLRSFASSIPDAVPVDIAGTPVSQIPVLQGVRGWGPDGQVSMVIDVTGSNSVEKLYQFLSPTKVQIGLGCTAVMAPEQYPFLDSGQLSGLLTGMKGGAEYEQLMGARAFGSAAMAGQSFAHLYLVLLILLGNLSLLFGWLDRRRRR